MRKKERWAERGGGECELKEDFGLRGRWIRKAGGLEEEIYWTGLWNRRKHRFDENVDGRECGLEGRWFVRECGLEWKVDACKGRWF